MSFNKESIFIASILAMLFLFSCSSKTNRFEQQKDSMKIDSVSFSFFSGREARAFDLSMGDVSSSGYYIPISVNGSLIGNALLDTGSPVCILPSNTMLGKERNRSIFIRNFEGTIQPANEFKYTTLKLGDYAIEYRPKSFYSSAVTDHPVIGGTILSDRVVKIDNMNHLLLFSRNPEVFSHSDASAVVRMPISNGVPRIRCQIDGIELEFILDTGADGIFANIPCATSFDLGHKKKSFSHTRLLCNTGKPDSTYIKKMHYFVGDVSVDSIAFHHEVIDAWYDTALLGMDFFQRFDYVILDYISKELVLGPVCSYKSYTYAINLNDNVNSLGITASRSGEVHTIWSVDDSMKSRGLEIGDTLISMNGNMQITDAEIIDLNYNYDSVTVVLKNKMKTMNVSLKRAYHIPCPDTVFTYGIIPPYRMYASIEKRTGKQGHYDGSRIIFSNKRSR